MRAISKKGSITVEAAIVLPIFLCAILSVIFMIKIAYTHELIQHALIETSDEIASIGYFSRISGMQDINTSLNDGIQNRADAIEENINTIVDAFETLKSLTDKQNDNSPKLNETSFLKNILCYIAKDGYEDAKTELFTPLARLCMQKYLNTGSSLNADSRLRALSIVNGLEGLDFSQSTFLDNNENIDLVIRYTINLPLPIRIFPKLIIVQRAAAKAWLGGDEPSAIIDIDDIWALNNFDRGNKIRSIFVANMPSNFPVIAKFDGSTATMIKSMDLTAASYKDQETIEKTLDGYIYNISSYKGQEKPWGSKGITIKEDEIINRELILVIPKNELPPQIEQLLNASVIKAANMGVRLRVERYGYKNVEAQ